MSVKTFTLRLTEEQLEFIGMKAAELGISKNDYIRRLLMGIFVQINRIRYCKESLKQKNDREGCVINA